MSVSAVVKAIQVDDRGEIERDADATRMHTGVSQSPQMALDCKLVIYLFIIFWGQR